MVDIIGLHEFINLLNQEKECLECVENSGDGDGNYSKVLPL